MNEVIDNEPAKHIEYLPPKPEEVSKFVQQVCWQMQQSNPTQGYTETLQGFGSFMNVVVRIVTKKLNKGVDSHASQTNR